MREKVLLIVVSLLLCMSASARRVWVTCFFAGDSGIKYDGYQDGGYVNSVNAEINSIGSDMELQFYNYTSHPVYIDLANSFVYINGKSQSIASLNTNVELDGRFYQLQKLERVRPNVISINTLSNTLFKCPIEENLRKDVITQGKYSCGFADLDFGYKGKFIDSQTHKGVKFQVGMTRHYDDTTTPLDVRAIITYSTDIDFSQKHVARVQNYITDIVIDDYNCCNGYYPNCAPFKDKRNYRFCTGGANPLGTIAGNITIAAMFAGSILLLAAPFL